MKISESRYTKWGHLSTEASSFKPSVLEGQPIRRKFLPKVRRNVSGSEKVQYKTHKHNYEL